MIQPGSRFDTSLRLSVVRDGRMAEVPLADLLRRRTIISVYMRNNTGSCDKQIASLATHAADFEALGCDLVGVSRDTPKSHLAYAARMGVTFPLVSDPHDAISRAADAMVEKSMYGKKYTGPARAAYVLDPDGTVVAVVDKVEPKDHARQLREALARL